MINSNKTGSKLTASIGLILASIVYVFYQNNISVSSVTTFKNNPVVNSSKPSTSAKKVVPVAKTTTLITKPVAQNKIISQVPQAPATSAPGRQQPVGQYADGTYTGDPADAYYGTIQVAAIIQNGKLADVQFLQHPNDRNTSIRINDYAMPILRQEAISVQSANVDIVSGATDSSGAFQQSLASALVQAKN